MDVVLSRLRHLYRRAFQRIVTLVTIPPPDSHFFRAAVGWMELKLPMESLKELAQISPACRCHIETLEIEWQVLAALLDWDTAFRIAEKTITLHSTSITGWIHCAYAARRKSDGGLSRAFAVLLPAALKFPDEGLIRYNLACYTAQLGELEAAWRWFEEALHRDPDPSGTHSYKAMALKDEDLKSLWDKIRSLK